jgi:hypothetical protein
MLHRHVQLRRGGERSVTVTALSNNGQAPGRDLRSPHPQDAVPDASCARRVMLGVRRQG